MPIIHLANPITLHGPAGGVFEQGEEGPRMELGAEPDHTTHGADLLRTRVLF